MEPTCRKLIELITEQKLGYQNLKELSSQKRQALIAGDLEKLASLTEKEEALILKLGKLENQRQECFLELAAKGGFDETATLQEALPFLPAAYQMQLKELQADFAVLIEKLSQLNEENMSLLERSLQFVNFTAEALSEQSKPVYDAEQQIKMEQLRNLLDKKV